MKRLMERLETDAEKARCHELVGKLPGVKAVVDELRTMSGGLYRFPSQFKDKK